MWSDFPDGPLRLVVVHDDVGEIGRADRVEVVLLGRQVAVAEALLDPGGGSQRRQVTSAGASQGLLERGGHEDAQVPPVDQFRAQEEHAVEEKQASAAAVVTGGDSAVSVSRS